MDLKTLLSEEGRTDPFSLYAVMHRDGKAARLGPKDGYAIAVFGYDAGLTMVTPSAPAKPLILRGHDTLMVTAR